MNRTTSPGYLTRMPLLVRRSLVPPLLSLALALSSLVACAKTDFTPIEAATNDALYQASLKAEKDGNWTKASKGFEQLTFQLPARDPLLPLAYYHLGIAHQHLNEFLLAAQAFSRVPENFPEDTLAGVSTYQAGISYSRLWKRPDLDADYGVTALSTFQSFLAAFPDSPLRDSAQLRIDALNEMFGEKNLKTATIYAKEGAYDSSIIYYRDVVAKYPGTKAAKHALLGLVKAYRAIAYREDALEACATLRQKYPADRDVLETCGPPAITSPAAATVPATKP